MRKRLARFESGKNTLKCLLTAHLLSVCYWVLATGFVDFEGFAFKIIALGSQAAKQEITLVIVYGYKHTSLLR